MPAIVFLVANRNEDPCRFSCLEDDHDLVGLGMTEVGCDEVVTSSLRSSHNGCIPGLRSVLDPVLKLGGDVSQHITTDGVLMSTAAEETDHALGLLKGLDEPVKQDAVEAAVSESNATLVVLVESIHGRLLCGDIPGA